MRGEVAAPRDRRSGRHGAARGGAGGLRRAGTHRGRHTVRRRRAGGGAASRRGAWRSTRSGWRIERASTAVAERWREVGISHAVAIERCGRSPDGRPRNMRGVDVSAWTAPLDDLFLGGPWRKLAVGDGGNEIGMGKLPDGLIARFVPNGASIACVTSCDHLVVAGVSNWGAYGRMAALAVLRPEWSPIIGRFLTAERDLAVTRATVDKAGAVDGVDGAPRGDGRWLRAGDPWSADRRARSHCTGEAAD